MELYLIRHGESVGNVLRHLDMPDSPLTELGKEQAEHVGAELAKKTITRVVSSPLIRALETAQPLAEAKGLPIEVWKILYEYRDGPDYTGPSKAELSKQFPGIICPDLEEAGWYYPSNDKPDIALERARRIISRLLSLDSSECVAMFAHGMLNEYILRAALEWGPRVSVRQDNTCINWLTFQEEAVCVRVLNDVSHLKE